MGFKKNSTVKKARVQRISDFMSKERINLYIFNCKSSFIVNILNSVIRDNFETWRISKIICASSVKKKLKNKFFCDFLNVADMDGTMKEQFARNNTKVLIHWNGNIKNDVIYVIWLLKGLKKEFWLYKQTKSGYLLEFFENSLNPNYSIENLVIQTEKILKSEKIRYTRKLSQSGSGSVYFITNKWFKVRVSDHNSGYLDDEMKVFNMGLFPGSDGLPDQLKLWLDNHTIERVF
jgi:hypothetical protein